MPETILDKTSAYVFKLLTKELPKEYIYHNYDHTYETVKAAEEIGMNVELNKSELEIVLLAAWLHDIGYINGAADHEEKGTEIAEKFLSAEGLAADKIDQVKACIMATKFLTEPTNLMEEVLCDADLVHIGKENYKERNELLREEIDNFKDVDVEQEDWVERELEFLQQHRFYTQYAYHNYGEQKQKNIGWLKKQLNKLEEKEEAKEKMDMKKKELKFKKNKLSVPERGIETMFRVTLRNHINLSAMADSKANIMLSINAIIISITISALFPKFETSPFLIWPTVILLVVCVLSIIFATLSTRPKVTEGKFTKEDIENKKANLLFFGNFFNVELEEFEWGMQEMMKDKDYLYGSMIRDFYFLGKVLSTKYRYLRICYSVFMFGLIISVIAFIIAFRQADF